LPARTNLKKEADNSRQPVGIQFRYCYEFLNPQGSPFKTVKISSQERCEDAEKENGDFRIFSSQKRCRVCDCAILLRSFPADGKEASGFSSFRDDTSFVLNSDFRIPLTSQNRSPKLFLILTVKIEEMNQRVSLVREPSKRSEFNELWADHYVLICLYFDSVAKHNHSWGRVFAESNPRKVNKLA
jgi:hypothetical protein